MNGLRFSLLLGSGAGRIFLISSPRKYWFIDWAAVFPAPIASTTPAAYLTGILAGKRAKEKGIDECILDTGRHPPITGSKIFASIKGVIDAGIECPHNEEKIPKEDRITGNHLDKDIMPAVNDIKSKIIGGK